MFCSKCGSKNDDDSQFCISCGAALKQQPASQGQPSQPQPQPMAQPSQPQPQVQPMAQPSQPQPSQPQPSQPPQQPQQPQRPQDLPPQQPQRPQDLPPQRPGQQTSQPQGQQYSRFNVPPTPPAGSAPQQSSNSYSGYDSGFKSKICGNSFLATIHMNSLEGLSGLIGGILMIIGVFLPFVGVRYTSMSISLFLPYGQPGDGIFILIMAIAFLVLLYFMKKLPYVIVSLIAAVVALFNIINVSFGLAGYTSYITFGPGFFVILFAVIFTVISAVLVIIQMAGSKSQ